MPIYLEGFSDRMKGLVKGWSKVYFEVKEENLPSANKIEVIRMFNKKGRMLGKITYELTPDLTVKIQGFSIDDWSKKENFGHRLLKWYIDHIRKRNFQAIEGGIYSTDARTSDRLDIFKAFGFDVRELGSMAGHTEYKVELRF
ncbi:MAG: hypothetical protein AB1779_07160 [Candidatus Thermoplasmatota archaeon]